MVFGGEKMGFSNNLYELMQKNDVNSYKLAKAVGVHISTVTNWLNGSNPKLGHLSSLSAFFRVPIDELLKERKGA